MPIDSWVEVRGEFFTGQALRGLGGGGIGQNAAAGSNVPLYTKGGWAQINLRPRQVVHAGAACGIEHPDARALRRRNDSCSSYVIIRLAGPLFYGGEFRRTRTGYAATRFTNDHVTLAAGFEF